MINASPKAKSAVVQTRTRLSPCRAFRIAAVISATAFSLSWNQRNVHVTAVLPIALTRLHLDPKHHSGAAIFFDLACSDYQFPARHWLRATVSTRNDPVLFNRGSDARRPVQDFHLRSGFQ